MATANEIYQRYLPLIVFEQQPGVTIRKEILRMRGLLASSAVRHPGANIDAATAEQLQSLMVEVFPNVDIRELITIQ